VPQYLDLVDIGSVGLWGEWHMSSTKDPTTGQPVPLPPLEVRKRIVDAWIAAFPKTPVDPLVGGDEVLKYAVGKGAGWRADCLGDMGGFSKTWNHMENFYPQALKAANAEEAWRKAPVAFETCWDMRKWKQEGWVIRFIYDYALRFHASYINNKSAPIPEGTRPEVERMLRRLRGAGGLSRGSAPTGHGRSDRDEEQQPFAQHGLKISGQTLVVASSAQQFGSRSSLTGAFSPCRSWSALGSGS
jgi:hypothetical protein